MKILIVLKKWPGGVGVMVRTIKKFLEKRGHYVEVLSRDDDLKITSFLKSIFPLRKKVKKIMKEKNFDIIYSRDWSIAFPLLFPFPLFRKRHYAGFGGLENNRISFAFEKVVGNTMGTHLICYGDPVKEEFPKSNQIINGVDTEEFKPNQKIKRIKNSVGFASWKTEEYNYGRIKKAVENAEKKFVVAEGIPHEKMPDFYNQIETFISLPPEGVGFNFVWIEAMACGVPKIIGSNVGIGNRLPIDKVENLGSIEDALKTAKKKDYRKLLGSNFSWDRSVDEHIRLWKRGLGR